MKEKETNNLLLVDGENLLHRSYHKFLNLKSKDGTPSGAIYGFMKSLHSAIFRFNITSVVVVFDNGRSAHRTKILPDYKGNRTKLGMDYESLQNQKKAIRRLLKLLAVPVVFDKQKHNNYECDDYIALLASLYKHSVLILSSDKDFCQLIDKRVRVISPNKDCVISIHNCEEIMGYKPEECVDYLCLTGDESDNIKGVNGIGPKKARVFLDGYGSIANYIKLDEKGINKQVGEKYPILRELIDLNHFIKLHPLKSKDIPIKYGETINYSKLDDIFSRYSMTSLKSKEFLSIFKSLKVWQIKS